MKRLFMSLVVVAALAAVAYGAAATLIVNGGGVQAGSDSDGFQCDTDGVTVAYTTAWDSNQNQYIIDKVRVDNIDPACDAHLVKVAFLEGTTPMGLTTGHANGGGCSPSGCSTGWMSIPTTNKPRAALLTSVKVSIFQP